MRSAVPGSGQERCSRVPHGVGIDAGMAGPGFGALLGYPAWRQRSISTPISRIPSPDRVVNPRNSGELSAQRSAGVIARRGNVIIQIGDSLRESAAASLQASAGVLLKLGSAGRQRSTPSPTVRSASRQRSTPAPTARSAFRQRSTPAPGSAVAASHRSDPAPGKLSASRHAISGATGSDRASRNRVAVTA